MNKNFFILCGGKFYLEWLLPTNWSSKNPFIKSLHLKNNVENRYEIAKSLRSRLDFAYFAGTVHVFASLPMLFGINYWTFLLNLFINIYPVIVQIYIGSRCVRLLKISKRLHVNNL